MRGAVRGSIAPRARMIALGLALASAVVGCARPSGEVGWSVVETRHFEIVTSLRVREARSLATMLERFDALIDRVTGLPSRDAGDRTRVVVLARPTELPTLRRFATNGILDVGMRESLIVSVAPASRPSAVSERILHQYAHFRLRETSLRAHPIWYEEGLAMLLSGAKVRGSTFVIGDLPWSQATALRSRRGRSIADLIELGPDERWTPSELDVFRVQSWALVRHLLLDRAASRGAGPVGITRYLDLLELGVAPRAAFASAFGLSTDAAELGIVRALDDGRMHAIEVPLDELDAVGLAGTVLAVRPARPGEIAAVQGEVLLLVDDAMGAERVFREALALDEREPRAHAGLGEALDRQGRFEEAESALRRAVELGPEDPSGHVGLGAHHELLARGADALEDMRRALARAREHFERALVLDEEDPETRARLGISHLFPGEDPARAIPYLSRALSQRPASDEIAVALAEARLVEGDELGARVLLSRAWPICGEATRYADGPGRAENASIPAIRARRAARARQVGLD